MRKNEADEIKFPPVKRVLEVINSCETQKQLKSCLRMISNYTNLVKSGGVVNSDLVKKRLMKEYKQKNFQLSMIKEYVEEQQIEKVETVEVSVSVS